MLVGDIDTARIQRDEKIISYFCRLIQLSCRVVTFQEDAASIDVPVTLRVHWRLMVRVNYE